MDNLNLAALLSSGNIEIAVLGLAAWFLKSLIGVATKTLTAFMKIEQQGENILAEQKKTNELLQRQIDGQHEISNILMYNIPPSKVVTEKKTVSNV